MIDLLGTIGAVIFAAAGGYQIASWGMNLLLRKRTAEVRRIQAETLGIIVQNGYMQGWIDAKMDNPREPEKAAIELRQRHPTARVVTDRMK